MKSVPTFYASYLPEHLYEGDVIPAHWRLGAKWSDASGQQWGLVVALDPSVPDNGATRATARVFVEDPHAELHEPTFAMGRRALLGAVEEQRV